MPESESERLKRLKEKQIRARDPLEKERKFQHSSALKEKRMQKPISLREDWRKAPYVIKAPLYGLIIGGIGAILLTKVWVSPYAIYAGVGGMLILTIFCMVLGNAIDLREDIKKHLK